MSALGSVSRLNWPVSQYLDTEVIFNSRPPSLGDTLRLPVPAFLPDRRLYIYLEALLTAAGNFFLGTRVLMINQGTTVGEIPLTLCDFTGLTPNQSKVRLFNSGGSPVGDSAVLTLAQPFNATITTVTIQPLRLNAQLTEVWLQVIGVDKGAAPMTGWRAYMGCLSTGA